MRASFLLEAWRYEAKVALQVKHGISFAEFERRVRSVVCRVVVVDPVTIHMARLSKQERGLQPDEGKQPGSLLSFSPSSTFGTIIHGILNSEARMNTDHEHASPFTGVMCSCM